MFHRTDIEIAADFRKVILLPHVMSEARRKEMAARIQGMDEETMETVARQTISEFGSRHLNFKAQVTDNFRHIEPWMDKGITDELQLISSMFVTKEYSFEAAALFNPSVVPHPDREDQFILSLRATGEGHISSIRFLEGSIDENYNISLNEPPDKFYRLPQREPFDGEDYDLESGRDVPLSSRIIYPVSPGEVNGMEDARFVKMEEPDTPAYAGTYTAYDGHHINSKVILTDDFSEFRIRSLKGKAVADKGMALFPRKINGKYAMIGRQDGEMLSVMYSDDLLEWNDYEMFMGPTNSWEIMQVGNCGSPVETDEGWIMLTHGVGALRKYCIGAVLLDLDDPTRVIGVLEEPMICPEGNEREGYVPNVVYSCGNMKFRDRLLIPYAMSDSRSTFGWVEIKELLSALKPQ